MSKSIPESIEQSSFGVYASAKPGFESVMNPFSEAQTEDWWKQQKEGKVSKEASSSAANDAAFASPAKKAALRHKALRLKRAARLLTKRKTALRKNLPWRKAKTKRSAWSQPARCAMN